MACPMIVPATSEIPIGLTPGLLSSAINLHAMNGSMPAGSTYAVASRFVTDANAPHKSRDAPRKEEHRLRQPAASIDEGPAAPHVRRAAVRKIICIADAVIPSKMIE